jgi:uncharacterized repeat protein (TIGR01451 family)
MARLRFRRSARSGSESIVPALPMALLAACLGVALLLTPAAAAPGEDDDPAPNPDMQQACGIDALVVLDESGSVEDYTDDVQDAFRAFIDALNNTGSRVGVVEFSTVARLPLPGTANRSYTGVTDASINTIFEPYIANNYDPNGSTDWEDGLRVGRYFLPRPSATRPHITVFITDGDPNQIVRTDRVTYDPGNPVTAQNEYERKVPLSTDEVDDADEDRASDRAVSNANGLKAMDSHVLAIAVGKGLTSNSSLNRLIDVSGPNVLTSGQPFTVGTDVYRVPDFDELEQGMRDLVFALCAPVVNVQKFIDITPDPGTDDLLPASGWEMTGVVTPTPASWAQPAGASGSTAVGVTGADGFVAFDWRPSSQGNQAITVTEEDPGAVLPGFVNDPTATSCTFRTPTQSDSPLTITVGDGTFTAPSIPRQAIVTCRMVNRLPADSSVDLEKYTNGADADQPTGPFVPAGEPVTWAYHVTNTGNTTLSSITLTDSVGGADPVAVACADPIPTSLPPGEAFVCLVEGVAQSGQYENTGTVNAVDSLGNPVVPDSDPSHYIGTVAGIDIVKSTNGEDANVPPGPFIAVGQPVNWTYLVTNTSNVTLNDIVVTDDQPGVVVSCPATTLPAAPAVNTMTCTATDPTAEPGAYANIGSATGVAADGLDTVVQDSDASHYFGWQASITLEKYTGDDPADTPLGPFFRVGDTVTWIYEVTNTGNVPLVWTVTDDQGLTVVCPRLLLLGSGRSTYCHASAPAEVGQHQNIATVNANVPGGPALAPVTDPANYFGIDSAIDLEKHTNGEDADEAPGPYVLVGSTVNWTYVVTNTGNSPLTDIAVTDLKGVAVSCPTDTLPSTPPNNTMTCTASGIAQADQYTNHAFVVGTDPIGDFALDHDPSHYSGGTPGIDVEKHTNGDDADQAPGVLIPEGGQVEWTYVVTNSGGVSLSNIVVTDDQGVAVACPQTTLAATESMTCTGTGTAILGLYSNLATATADSNLGEVTDDDPSNYFGFVSEIAVEKFVNGDDADAAPGLDVEADDALTWTYEVTNPGNIAIRGVTLVDDQGLVPAFVGGDGGVIGDLEPGETWTYEAASTAITGLHTNIATVNGLDILEQPVEDTDPANYTAIGPEPALIGDTVWEDLDQDGDQDADEPGIEGARVDITNTATGTTVTVTTDADGHYRASVAPGTYTVTLDMSSVDSVLTTPGSYTLTLAEGDEDLSADFGVFDDSAELPDTALGERAPSPATAILVALGLLMVAAAHRLRLAAWSSSPASSSAAAAPSAQPPPPTWTPITDPPEPSDVTLTTPP